MRNNTMHFKTGVLALALWMGLALAGCSNVLHNGTEMALSQVKLTGLPASPYAAGTTLVFSYNTGDGWIHDNASTFTDPTYSAKVLADGSWTVTFTPALVITSSTLQFLVIDSGKNWDTMKITKKVSGKSGIGDDGLMDNTWGGSGSPVKLVGTVSGDDVTWVWQ